LKKNKKVKPEISIEKEIKKNRINNIEKTENSPAKKLTSNQLTMIILLSLTIIAVSAVLLIIKFHKTPTPFTLNNKKKNEQLIEPQNKDLKKEGENEALKKGIESYNRGYNTDAITQFNEVIESDASDNDKAKALMFIGLIKYKDGKYDAALKFYSRALLYNKENPDIYRNIARAYQRQGDYNKAYTNINRAIEMKSDTEEYYLLKGNILFQRGNYKDALKTYLEAEKIKGNYPALLFNIATTYSKIGDELQENEYYKKAGSSDKVGTIAYRAYSQLGVNYLIRKDFSSAEKYLKLALNINSNDAATRYYLALTYLKQNKNDEALKELTQAETKGGKNTQILEKIAEAYDSLNKIDKSLETYKKALAGRKTNAIILSKIGEIYHRMGKLDEALLYYKKITKNEPLTENARIAYLNMGNILDDQGNFKEAIKYYKKSLTISQKDDRVYYSLGVTYKHMGRPELAIDAWEDGAKLNRKSPKFFLAKANLYYEKKHYDLAQQEYGKIIKKWPTLSDAHFKSSIIYAQKRDLDFAIKGFKKVIELNNNKKLTLKSYINLARLYLQKENSNNSQQEAISAIKKALLLAPGNDDALLTLGDIYYEQQNFNKSIDVFFQLLKQSHSEKKIATAYNGLAKSYFKLKLYRKSMENFTKAVQNDPGNEVYRLNRRAATEAYENELENNK